MLNRDFKDSPDEYLIKMKAIEESLIAYLEKTDEPDNNFNDINNILEDQKLLENKYYVKSFLYLIVSISNHYHRSQSIITKLELIIKNLQDKIQKLFSNSEIFHIFQTSKRLLLFLFKQNIISPTDEIYSIIKNNKKYVERKYIEYFYPELEVYMIDSAKRSIQYQVQELNKDEINVFHSKREKGENDNHITEFIRNDQVIDFISYVNKSNISPSTTIQPSIYETNLFLTDKTPTLIEYATFCGSIQIFRYLYQQNVELKPSIWSYAVHGKNAEIIHFLEDQIN